MRFLSPFTVGVLACALLSACSDPPLPLLDAQLDSAIDAEVLSVAPVLDVTLSTNGKKQQDCAVWFRDGTRTESSFAVPDNQVPFDATVARVGERPYSGQRYWIVGTEPKDFEAEVGAKTPANIKILADRVHRCLTDGKIIDRYHPSPNS